MSGRSFTTTPAAGAPNQLRIVEGAHEDLDSGSELPFRCGKILGLGASGVVQMAEDTFDGRVFAHKMFRSTVGPVQNPWTRRAFLNEIDILKRLGTHRHIINMQWSYVRGNEFGILLSPVADEGDLNSFLSAIRNTRTLPTPEQQSILYRAYGCLANGLAYIHSHAIRHKDIKPQNILVHRGCMIYTDFGIALDGTHQSTTTTGLAEGFTRRYCAPEIVEQQPRNSSSDVFSLGCVFLEILAVLVPHFTAIVSDHRPYAERLPDLFDPEKLSCHNQDEPSSKLLLNLSRRMLCCPKEERLTLDKLISKLCFCQLVVSKTFFCLSCKRSSINATAVHKHNGALLHC